jgi:cysteine desulfurase/selenocysteine lyase
MSVNVQSWNADVVVCSGHKMLGPTGFGVLWGKKEWLETLSPFLYGGEMIQEVTVEKTTYKEVLHRFEAGTPSIAEVIAGKEAVNYLSSLGMNNVREHEKEITRYALSAMQALPYIHIYGPQDLAIRGGIVSFTMDGVHAHDIAQLVNEDNICIRSGTHCAMPLHHFYHIPASARASFYIYTTKEDIDIFIESIQKVYKTFH